MVLEQLLTIDEGFPIDETLLSENLPGFVREIPLTHEDGAQNSAACLYLKMLIESLIETGTEHSLPQLCNGSLGSAKERFALLMPG